MSQRDAAHRRATFREEKDSREDRIEPKNYDLYELGIVARDKRINARRRINDARCTYNTRITPQYLIFKRRALFFVDAINDSIASYSREQNESAIRAPSRSFESGTADIIDAFTIRELSRPRTFSLEDKREWRPKRPVYYSTAVNTDIAAVAVYIRKDDWLVRSRFALIVQIKNYSTSHHHPFLFSSDSPRRRPLHGGNKILPVRLSLRSPASPANPLFSSHLREREAEDEKEKNGASRRRWKWGHRKLRSRANTSKLSRTPEFLFYRLPFRINKTPVFVLSRWSSGRALGFVCSSPANFTSDLE